MAGLLAGGGVSDSRAHAGEGGLLPSPDEPVQCVLSAGGLLLGAVYAALYSVLAMVWSPLVCVLLVLAFHLWITGAFHEDGLADCADALAAVTRWRGGWRS